MLLVRMFSDRKKIYLLHFEVYKDNNMKDQYQYSLMQYLGIYI